MIKAVYFDAIDTLFAAYPDKIGMYQRIIKEVTGFVVDYDTMSRVWDEIVTETESKAEELVAENKPNFAWNGFNEKILKKLGYTKEDIKEKGEILRLESWTNPRNFFLYPDVRETLEKLTEQNILIGCISNEAEGLNKFFTHFDIDEYFKSISISEVEKCEKPSTKIFEIGLDKLDVKPEEAIFVGDSVKSDYMGAKNVRMIPVLIDRENKINDNEITKINELTQILDIVRKEQSGLTIA